MTDDTKFDPESHMIGYQWGYTVNDAFDEPPWAQDAFLAGMGKITDLIMQDRGTAEVLEIQEAIIDARLEFLEERDKKKEKSDD